MSLLVGAPLLTLLTVCTPLHWGAHLSGQLAEAPPEEANRLTLLLATDVGYDSDTLRAQTGIPLVVPLEPTPGLTAGTLAFVEGAPFGESGPFAQLVAFYRKDHQLSSATHDTVVANPIVGLRLKRGAFLGAVSYGYQSMLYDGDPLMTTHRGSVNAGFGFDVLRVQLEASARMEAIRLPDSDALRTSGQAAQLSWSAAFSTLDVSLLYRMDQQAIPDLAYSQSEHGPGLRVVAQLGPMLSVSGEVGMVNREYRMEQVDLGSGSVFTGELSLELQSTPELSFKLGLQATRGNSPLPELEYDRYLGSLGLSYFAGLL